MSFPLSSHAAVSVRVALEPVYNVLNTFSLLTSAEHMIGLNTWVIPQYLGDTNCGCALP